MSSTSESLLLPSLLLMGPIILDKQLVMFLSDSESETDMNDLDFDENAEPSFGQFAFVFEVSPLFLPLFCDLSNLLE